VFIGIESRTGTVLAASYIGNPIRYTQLCIVNVFLVFSVEFSLPGRAPWELHLGQISSQHPVCVLLFGQILCFSQKLFDLGFAGSPTRVCNRGIRT